MENNLFGKILKNEELFITNQKIYIDTSSLMNVSEMEKFISIYKESFEKNGKKIILLREVCLELVKHYINKDSSKHLLVSKLFSLLRDNLTIFTFEDDNLTLDEAKRSFADKDILARLTKDRTDISQILITSDKDLSWDAYQLSNSYSCRGLDVTVCDIGVDGSLMPVEFLDDLDEKKDDPSNSDKENSAVMVNKTKNDFENFWGYGLSFLIGGIIFKYSEPLSKVIRNNFI